MATITFVFAAFDANGVPELIHIEAESQTAAEAAAQNAGYQLSGWVLSNEYPTDDLVDVLLPLATELTQKAPVDPEKIKRWMKARLASGRYVDSVTNEVNLTQLAEAAIDEFNLDENANIDDEDPFEWAFQVGEWWEQLAKSMPTDGMWRITPDA